MSKYSSKDFVIKIDKSDGGALQDMSSYIDQLPEIVKLFNTVEATCASDTYEKAIATGIIGLQQITIGGFYDDTASTGPDAVFNTAGYAGAERTLEITYGSTKKTTVEVIIVEYARLGKVKDETRFRAVLRPTGTLTEA